jgi:hypothetical protein
MLGISTIRRLEVLAERSADRDWVSGCEARVEQGNGVFICVYTVENIGAKIQQATDTLKACSDSHIEVVDVARVVEIETSSQD